MLRALSAPILIGLVFLWSGFAHADRNARCPIFFAKLKSAEREAARLQLENQRLTFLAEPPGVPVRTLNVDEVSVTPMNGGKTFQFQYSDSLNRRYREGAKESVGNVISFTGSRGQTHQIEIVGLKTKTDLLADVTARVLKLPAHLLEATKKIEIQSFEADPHWHGLAYKSMFVLNRSGLTDRTLRHEFGHNISNYIWGSTNPGVEWANVVKLDGQRLVSAYATESFSSSGLTEDLAESVAKYLGDAAGFRAEFPNRAALLDTVFHPTESTTNSPFATGGVWKPLRDDYQARRSLLSRVYDAHPDGVIRAATGGAIIGAFGGYAYFLKFKFAETSGVAPTATPQPTLPESRH